MNARLSRNNKPGKKTVEDLKKVIQVIKPQTEKILENLGK